MKMSSPSARYRGITARTVVGVTAALLLHDPSPAYAWKVTTHMLVAKRGAERLEDQNLKGSLLSFSDYLEGGAVGTDFFYAPPFTHTVYSDLAHYCFTDELAKTMVDMAGTDPPLRAFALGWASHNVADSVAHPWVNGFVGDAFHDYWDFAKPLDKSINKTHGKLEAWVNARLAMIGSDAALLAIDTYSDPRVQDLMMRAYDKVYATARDCNARQIYKPLTREMIRDAADSMEVYVFITGGGLSDTLPPLPGNGAFLAAGTYQHYVELTERYIASAWSNITNLVNFNLDQGVAQGGVTLHDIYPDVVPQGGGDVFNTPGTTYVPPDGGVPGHDDKCSRLKSRKCAPQSLTRSGGDNPDDAVAGGSATLALDSVLKNGPAAFRRLALKRGEAWPWLFARQERAARTGLDALRRGDQTAFMKALASARALFRAATADRGFQALFDAGERPELDVIDEVANVGVLDNGFAEEAVRSVEAFEEPVRKVAPAGLAGGSVQPLLLVPSGGLYGLSQNEQFKVGLEAHLRSGGTVLVFAQQHGSDYSILPTPDGRPIHAWGWHEDNSCYTNAAYIENFHPILASQSSALVTSNIDGYFDSIPENAIILLRRLKNGFPAMFMYPYGQGWVIVSSSYDDSGSFNQSGPGARAIIRDAIAWAKKPADLPVNAPGSTVGIALHVKNVTDLPASHVKLTLMSPSRDRVITEQTVSMAVAAGGAAEASFSYAFPADAELGIYHVDYELLDEAGVTVQPVAEEDTGRIVMARPPNVPYRPQDLSVSILMPGGEKVVRGQPVTFRYRLTNRASSARRLRTYWEFNHALGTLAQELVVPANATAENEVTQIFPVQWGWGAPSFFIHVFEEGGTPRPFVTAFVKVPGETAAYQLSDGKGFRIQYPKAQISVTTDRPLYSPGDTAALAISVTNALELPWSGTLRVRRWFDPPGGLALAERPFSLEASGSARIELSIPVHVSHPGRAGYYVEVGAAGASAGAAAVILEVPDPELRAVGSPTWSGTAGGGTVSWELENIRPVPLASGTLKATFRAGSVTISEESQPSVLGASPNGRGTFGATVPLIPPNFFGEVVLEADNGFAGAVILLSNRIPV